MSEEHTFFQNTGAPVNVEAGVHGNGSMEQAGSVPFPPNNGGVDAANNTLQHIPDNHTEMSDLEHEYHAAQAQQPVAPIPENEVTGLMNEEAQAARTAEADQHQHGGEGPGSADAPPQGTENDQGPTDPGFDNGMVGGAPPPPEEFTNYAPADFTQTGGDGFRLGVDAEMVGGQAVVEGYDNEQATCGGYGEELTPQVGGGSPFNFITDPASGTTLSIFSGAGKALLKSYVKAYKHMQSGGAALLEGVDAKATGALYDGVQNAGAENMPDACGLTYDAQGDNWTHTQVGGADCDCEECEC